MADAFFLIGLILIAGFVANLIFSRLKISQVLILIALGFLLGSVFGIVDASKGSVLQGLAPFIGTLALIILLFDGGISLNIVELAQVLPKATLFTILAFVLSVIATAALTTAVFGWNWLYGLLLGAVVGGTSSAIVIAMVEKTSAQTNSKNLLVLESSITDSLCIITAFIILQLIMANVRVDASTVLNLLASAFSIALLAGALAAIAWLAVLKKLARNEFPYMLTLAVVFLLYSLVETAKGNGGIAVFCFGLVLGNAERLANLFNVKGDYSLDAELTYFQDEVTFFTRTFFFVFLGLILNLSGITLSLVGVAIALCILFLAIRAVAAKIILPSTRDLAFVTTMLPRGLAAAVLAGLPAARNIQIPGFAEIALLVIIITNVIATIGAFIQPAAKLEQKQPKVVSIKK